MQSSRNYNQLVALSTDAVKETVITRPEGHMSRSVYMQRAYLQPDSAVGQFNYSCHNYFTRGMHTRLSNSYWLASGRVLAFLSFDASRCSYT